MHSCTHWLRPRNPSPPFGLIYEGRYWSTKIDDISMQPLGLHLHITLPPHSMGSTNTTYPILLSYPLCLDGYHAAAQFIRRFPSNVSTMLFFMLTHDCAMWIPIAQSLRIWKLLDKRSFIMYFICRPSDFSVPEDTVRALTTPRLNIIQNSASYYPQTV